MPYRVGEFMTTPILYSTPHEHPLIIDATITLTILFAVWFFCEWLIRRRAVQNGS